MSAAKRRIVSAPIEADILAAPQLNFCFGPWPSQRPTCAEREHKLKWRKEQKKRIGGSACVEKKIVEGSYIVCRIRGLIRIVDAIASQSRAKEKSLLACD